MPSKYHGVEARLLDQSESPKVTIEGYGFNCPKDPSFTTVCVIGIKPKTRVWKFHLKDTGTNEILTDIDDSKKSQYLHKLMSIMRSILQVKMNGKTIGLDVEEIPEPQYGKQRKTPMELRSPPNLQCFHMVTHLVVIRSLHKN